MGACAPSCGSLSSLPVVELKCYMGSKHYLIQPFYYKHAYILLAMGAYGGGGAHVVLSPRIPYREGAACVPIRFYASF
jgi:hypothetical protein